MNKSIKNVLSSFLLSFFIFNSVLAGNIDTVNNKQWAWGSHMGWINFGTSSGDVTVSSSHITGYAWSALYGWINLAPNMAGLDNTCDGNISNYAWSSMFGYINFSGAVIDGNGYFQGQATTSSNGNIVFQGTNFSLRTDWRPTCSSSGGIAINEPLSGSTLSDVSPTISGNGATPGSTVIVTGPNGETCSTLVGGSGTWSCDVDTSLPEGSTLLSATEILANGDALPSVNVSLIIDASVPLSPTLSDIAGDTTNTYLTNDATPPFTGTGEIGSTIVIKSSTGLILGTGTVDGSGNWSMSPNIPLVEGSQNVDIVSTDSGGNTSSPLSITIIVDTIAPNTPTIANPTNVLITNDNTPTINGTGEAGSIFTIKDGSGTVIGTGIVDESGNYTFTPVNSLADGSITFSVTTTDTAGNKSIAATRTFTIDTSAPTPLTIITPINTSITGDNTPTLTGSGEANTIFEVRDGLGNILGTGTVDPTGSYSFTPLSALHEGLNTYSVTLTDSANNITPAVTSTFTVDTGIPSAPSVTSVNTDITSPYSVNTTTPALTGSGEIGAVISIYSSPGVLFGTGMVQPDGSWSIVPTTPLGEGDNLLNIRQTDIAGNTSLDTAINVFVDSMSPLTPSVTSVGGDSTPSYLSSDTTPSITGTGSSGDTITIKDSLGNILGTTLVDGSGNWSLDISPAFSDGNHTLSITATDNLGNISPVTIVSLTIDTTSPTLPIPTSVGGDNTSPYITNDITPTFTGTGEIGSIIHISTSTGFLVGTGLVDVFGNWYINSSFKFPEGNQNVLLQALDILGNTSSSLPLPFIIDSSSVLPPVITSVGGDTTVDYDVNDTTPTIAGVGTPGNIITIKNSLGSIVGTDLVDTFGNWSIDINPSLPDMVSSVFSITAKNVAGTESSPFSLTVNVNTTLSSSSSSGGGGGGWAGSENKGNLPKDTVTSDLKNTLITQTNTNQNSNMNNAQEASQEVPQGNPSTDVPMSKTIDGKIRSYVLKNDFKSCEIIDNLNNDMFRPEYLTKFNDLNKSKFIDDIIQMEKVGIIDGDSPELFQPTRTITRVEFLKILLRSHCYEYREEDTSDLPFTDIDKSVWQAKVVKKGWTLGVINGDTNTDGEKVFRPNDTISKAEAIKMLINIGLLQIGEPYTTSYNDVYKTWYERYVADGEYLGVIDPKSDKYLYNPESSTLREDMVHMTMKLVHLYR